MFFICFILFTQQCGDNCVRSCFSNDPDMECFVLDNHGYVIVSRNLIDAGKFFGEVNGRLMQHLIFENIYEEINITDYQAVCEDPSNEGSPANILQTVNK